MDQIKAASESALARSRRQITRIVTDPKNASIRFTLGCGHENVVRVAVGPLISITDIYGVELGDEMDCPHCAVATTH